MFLHLSVILFRGVGVCIQGDLHLEGGLRRGGGRPPNRILRDTVNERAVRILLECILVYFLSLLPSIVISLINHLRSFPGGI